MSALFEGTVRGAAAWLLEPHVNGDPRVRDWPLMGWEIPVAMGAAYVVGIPFTQRLMRDRAPFKLKAFATLHNLALFLLSLYMAVETLRQSYINFGWRDTGVRLYCNPVDPLGPSSGKVFSPSGAALARVLYIHYVSKAYEFVDTAIMLLKKNNRQVSFLHVYHHATTFVPVWWANVRYGPGGDAWFCCFLNSTIHVLMYGYYLLSTLGFRMPALKPCVTLSQMIQFCAFIFQGTAILYHDCYKPRIAPVQLVVQCTIFLFLFTHFFVTTYVGSKRRPADKKAA